MDLPSNIQRLVEIADLIDVQVFAGTRMEIYQPKVASAEELATEMTKVMQAYASSVPQPENFTAQFLPLPRINQLLVISHSEAAWTYARRWLERIDVIAEGPGRRIFVYPVENGKAEELANVLSAALGLPAPAGGGQKRTLEDLHRSTPGGQQVSLAAEASLAGAGPGPLELRAAVLARNSLSVRTPRRKFLPRPVNRLRLCHSRLLEFPCLLGLLLCLVPLLEHRHPVLPALPQPNRKSNCGSSLTPRPIR